MADNCNHRNFDRSYLEELPGLSVRSGVALIAAANGASRNFRGSKFCAVIPTIRCSPGRTAAGPLRNLGGLETGRVEAVAAALGDQQPGVGRIGLHLLAQAVNVALKGVGRHGGTVAPDLA
jgi:hypothetical protein